LKFQREVWAERACAAANEKELTNAQKVEGKKKKKFNKNGNNPTGPGIDPPAAGRRLDLSGYPNFFEFFEFLFYEKINSLKILQDLLVLWKFFVPLFSAGWI
jgi:hypothetical protein